MRRQLATANDVTLSAYTDAIVVTGELSRDGVVDLDLDAAPRPVAPRAKPRRWFFPAMVAAAAALATVVIRHPAASTSGYQASQLVAAIPASARPLDGAAWSAMRGARNVLSERARTVRIGALLTDLEFRVARGVPMTGDAFMLASLLEDAPAGAPLANHIRAIARDSSTNVTTSMIDELEPSAMNIVDPRAANAGMYLEAARLATSSGDATFFDRAPIGVLSWMNRDDTLDAPVKGAFDSLDALVRTHPRDAAAVNAAVIVLLHGLAR